MAEQEDEVGFWQTLIMQILLNVRGCPDNINERVTVLLQGRLIPNNYVDICKQIDECIQLALLEQKLEV